MWEARTREASMVPYWKGGSLNPKAVSYGCASGPHRAQASLVIKSVSASLLDRSCLNLFYEANITMKSKCGKGKAKKEDYKPMLFRKIYLKILPKT